MNTYAKNSFKKNTEGLLTSREGETLNFRVYSDGGIKIEGFNTLEFFTNEADAQKFCRAYGLTKIEE